MRKPSLKEVLSNQQTFKSNSQLKYHAQLYVYAVYHMNDMLMVSVIRMQYS